MRNLRLALRSFRKRPGVTLLAVLSLAVAMGLSTAAFSILDAFIFRELPVREPSQLAWLLVRDRQDRYDVLNWMEFERMRSRMRSADGVLAQSRHSPQVRLADRADFPITAGVSDNFFDVLGVRAARGDVFHSGADQDHIVVISDRYWKNTLAADPNIVGRTLNVGGAELQIIGVTPPGFTGVQRGLAVDLVVPPATFFRTLRIGSPDDPKNTDFETLARLRPGVTHRDAQREMETLFRQAEADGISNAPGRKAMVEAFTESSALTKLRANGVFPAMMLLILLIAAMNIAGLRLVDNEARRRDTGVRVALGAGRLALAHEHVLETVLISFAGAALGMMLAMWLIDLAPAMLYAGQSYVEYGIRLDWRAFAFSAACLLTVALIGSLIPLSEAWRYGVTPLLQTRTTHRPSRWLSGLLVGQMAFVTAVTCSAAVLWRSLDKLAAIRPAMDPDRKTLLFRGHWDGKGEYALQADAIAAGLEGLPGVQSVAYARRAMLSGSGGGAAMNVEIPGAGTFSYRYNQVSPSYFAATGARVLRGRPFDRGDSAESAAVVLVNESFVRKFFATREPLAQWVRIGSKDRQIVGIVEDGPSIHLKERPEPYFYLPFAQAPVGYLTFFVSCARNPGALTAAVRQTVRSTDSSIILTSFRTLSEHMNQARSDERLAAGIAAVLAAVGLLLAAAGLFGVTYHSVSRRAREFGIRLALGATQLNLKGQVLAEAAFKVAIAIPCGWALAYSARRIIQKYLYGVEATDPWMFAAASGIVAVVACAAALYPAIRAARVDAAEALRQE